MVVEEFKQLVHVPSDPWIQLRLTITALYNAWDKPSAKQQRINMGVKLVGLPLIVQSMVFGNKNFNSGSGVVYTRNPRTGDREVCGKYFVCGQGNEPQEGCGEMRPIKSLQYAHIELYDRLYELMSVLERHHKDMQEIDFTFEDGQLFVLQTSNGRRSLVASLKILTSFVDEGHLSEKDALMRIQPTQMRHFLTRTIDPAYSRFIL
jgi:pyruvate,orthophosphate dikinase